MARAASAGFPLSPAFMSGGRDALVLAEVQKSRMLETFASVAHYTSFERVLCSANGREVPPPQ